MSNSEDEFDAYNLGEFTEQDFAKIDFDLNNNQGKQSHTGGPAVLIEIEDISDSLMHIPKGLSHFTAASSRLYSHNSEMSPFKRHRAWNGILSVTDLVSPSWYVDITLRASHSNVPQV